MAKSPLRMSLEELKALVAEREKSAGAFIAARNEIDAACKKYGVQLWDVIEATGGLKRRKTAPVVWRNPSDHSETWSGRGRPPKQWHELFNNAGIDRGDNEAVKKFLLKKGFGSDETKQAKGKRGPLHTDSVLSPKG
jgi:DNA-binding protein H-NS